MSEQNAEQPNSTQTQQQPPTTPATGETPQPLTWDAWHSTLNDDQRKLIEQKFDGDAKGLKGALEKERDEAKNLSKQLKALQDKAEKGSELEKMLADLQAQLTAANQEKSFILEAPQKGVNNIKAAYKLASADGLIDAKGAIDWDALKASYPELFSVAKPPAPPDTNAGNTGKKSAEQQLQDATKLAAKKFGINIPQTL
jgi:hypothetical protein